MGNEQAQLRQGKWPHFGMRIIKTGICVFICLLLNYLFSPEVALYSSLAAVATLETTLAGTMRMAVSELVGTGLGGAAALSLLPLAQQISIDWIYVFVMPAGMMLVIYMCNVFRMPQAASLGGFVYIAVLITPFTAIPADNPYLPALYRITDTAAGVVIALVVNRFIAPPKRPRRTSIRIPCNTYNDVYACIQDHLHGHEELILFDSRLTDPDLDAQTRRGRKHSLSACENPVSIPVPLELSDRPEIHGIYAASDFTTTPFVIKQRNGYAQLPCCGTPITVMWHVDPHGAQDARGVNHPRKRGFKNLKMGGYGTTRHFYGPKRATTVPVRAACPAKIQKGNTR